MLFGVLLAHPFSQATSSPPGDKREYVLVINTYTESDPWSHGIISDITARIEQVDNTEIYTEHLNMILINSQANIDEFTQDLVNTYGTHPPRMLVLIGSSAYLLRDFPKNAWGREVATIICAEEDYIGPDKYYIEKQAIPEPERIPISNLADERNLTLLYAPVFLEPTVD
mgnify:CR=1 FL=1